MYELIGYAASLLVAVSLTMSSILRLRIINLAGAALFAVYGVLIGSMPVAAVNTFIVGVNLWYLARMLRTREYFRILEVEPGSEYLRHFLDFNRQDIRRFLPDFAAGPAEGELAFFVLRDVIPAGVVVGEPRPDGTFHIRLDYVLPRYRDFRTGEFVFRERASFFRERGIRRLSAHAHTRQHRRYLRRMGFSPVDAGQGRWERQVG